MKHCCDFMDSWADCQDPQDLLEYDPKKRDYSFVIDEKYYPGGKRIGLNYCPWCGAKL
jgi:hypothetical protein